MRTYAYVNAENCSMKTLGRILHFADRDTMDIPALGRCTVEKVVAAGLADLFQLTRKDVLTLNPNAVTIVLELCSKMRRSYFYVLLYFM